MNTDEYCRLEATDGHTVLRVTFHWTGDRYAHTVWACHGQQAVPVLNSVEGAGDETWPPSPPIQQVNCSGRDGQTTAVLGMGMAGRSHWSISVESCQQPLALEFDVACRPGGGLGQLASGYQTLAPSAGQKDGDAIVFAHALGRCQLQPIPVDGYSNASLDVANQNVAMHVDTRPLAGSKTFRWKYRVTIGSAV